MRKLKIAALSLGLVIARPVLAIDNACWNRNIQRLDYYTNPPEGGDAAFFTAVAPKGVIALLYATRNTMNTFPISLYEMRTQPSVTPQTGCTNSYLNSLPYFMSKADAPSLQGPYLATTSYPDPEPAYTSLVTVSDGINPAAFYQYGQWPNGPPGALGVTSNPQATATAACSAATGADPTLTPACASCVSSSGYWLNPKAANNDVSPAAGVFSGNFLRFYPPKWVLLKLAYKRLLNSALLSTVREGVIVQNGAVGGYLQQKLLPSSCQGQGAQNGVGILKQKLQALDGIAYTSSANPLAEMLFNTGYYLSGDDPQWAPSGYFTSTQTIGLSGDDGRGGPCANNPCGQDFVVLFSDGRGDEGNPACDPTLGRCQKAQSCSLLGMGGEQDGDNFLDPSIAGGAGALITGVGVRQTPAGTCDMDFLDDVARWLANNKMKQSFAGNNTVITYVVGVGSNTYGGMQALKAAATAGKGNYVEAQNFQQLEQVIRQVLLSIIQRSTSFSVAAITTVQTRGSTFAFIPRFKPLPGNDWEGRLYRFKLFNEFAAGCTAQDYNKAPGADWLNPNGNASCNDVYLVDADSSSATSTPTMPGPNFFNSFVGEDDQGNFNKLNTSAAYPWPFATNPSPPPQYLPAKPVWEAAQGLTQRVDAILAGTSTDQRTIYTVYDSTGSGKYDTRVSFDTSATNLSIITPLLKLGGVNSTFCTELSALSKHTYTTESDCAADVINFVRGLDILYQNTYNQTSPPPNPMKSRPNILGDIYHSSPILVTPPAPTFLCDLGVVTQCVPSLYNTKLTPLVQTSNLSAYTNYFTNNQYRTQILLVGANDGMLHAFNAGNDRLGDDPETPVVESSTSHYFDLGTGREMWAFVPPDMLPKLSLYVMSQRHEQFVDGTPMVRDIWVDGSGSTTADGQKQVDEFHTVAVVGEREGGRHYFALDVTVPDNPKFLWAWPLPGTTDDMYMGETWNDHAPAPPPIGPVAGTDGCQSNPATCPITVNGTKARERYIVALGGGFDPNFIRGRGVFMLDAWTGQPVFRFRAVDSSGASDPRQFLFPVAASVSMLDANSDGLFDTAVVGDTMGQVWTLSMLAPGTDTTGTGVYSNWYGGRAFNQAKGLALYNKTPFFQPASASILPTGEVRVFLGTGDRFAIKDSTVTSCGLDNILGCLRRGCTFDVNALTQQSGTHTTTGEWAISTNTAASPTTSTLATDGSTGQSNTCADTDNVNVAYSLTCGATTATFSNLLTCDWGATQPGIDCPTSSGKPLGTQFTPGLISCASPFSNGTNCFTPTVTPQAARFYSIKLFDGASRSQFTTSAGAATYDGAALTDTDLVNADTTSATSGGNGWWVQYAGSYEKTTSGGLVLGGCAIWNSLVPTTQGLSCNSGATPPKDTANLYQADAITGAIQCGTSSQTVRYISRQTIVPPPMPTPVVAVNQSTGQVTYSGVSLEPGVLPLQISVGGGDVMGTIHWLEVPRQTHNCRHGAANCN